MRIEFDEGFAFGLGVFETIKIVEGQAFFLEKHLRRLQKGMDFFSFSHKISEKEIQQYVVGVEEKNFALKVMVSEKNFLFLKREDPYHNQKKEKGMKVLLSSVLRNSTSPMIYYKTLQYGDNILEKRKAKVEGYDEVIFLNERGFVTEGAVSNLFFLKGEKLYTPPIKDGLLAGTMREYLLEQYPVEEISISEKDLENFDACFLCNALMGVLWIESIGEISYQKTARMESIMRDLAKIGF